VKANVVPRFFMLSMSYNFNRVGSNKMQKKEPSSR